MGSSSSKGKAMSSGYPKQAGQPAGQQYQPQQYPPQQQMYPHHDENVDDVTREHSACQKQFNPGDETYRCISCEITEDTPGNIFYKCPIY